MAWRPFVRVTLSILCGGLFYAGWLPLFILTAGANSPFVNALRWLSAPVVTAAGFAVGMAVGERLTSTRRGDLLRLLLWPLAGCAVGAGAVYPFGPMLIVFGMFAVGTASVLARELVLYVATSRATTAKEDASED